MATKEFWPVKDPDEVLDYSIDWAARLGTDTLASSDWDLVSGSVTLGISTRSDTVSTLWLSGGTLGETCEIHNRITTAGGRTMDQTVFIKVKKK